MDDAEARRLAEAFSEMAAAACVTLHGQAGTLRRCDTFRNRNAGRR